MDLFRYSYVCAAVALGLVAGCNSDSQTSTPKPTITEYQYSTKAVYAPKQDAATYQAAPAGFTRYSLSWWPATARAHSPAPSTTC